MNKKQIFELIAIMNKVVGKTIDDNWIHDSDICEDVDVFIKSYEQYFDFKYGFDEFNPSVGIRDEIILSSLGEQFINKYAKKLLKTLDTKLIKILCNERYRPNDSKSIDIDYQKLIDLQLVGLRLAFSSGINNNIKIYDKTRLGRYVVVNYKKQYFESIGEYDFNLEDELKKEKDKLIHNIAKRLNCTIQIGIQYASFVNSDGIKIKRFNGADLLNPKQYFVDNDEL